MTAIKIVIWNSHPIGKIKKKSQQGCWSCLTTSLPLIYSSTWIKFYLPSSFNPNINFNALIVLAATSWLCTNAMEQYMCKLY